MPIMNSHQDFEVAAATLANKVTVAGSTGTVLGWLSSSDFAVMAGVVIALAGFIVNWYYRRQTNRREKEAHAVFLRRMERESKPAELMELYADE